MKKPHRNLPFLTLLMLLACTEASQQDSKSQPTVSRDFEIVKYNNPETTSFLGVGLWAWPLPMDYDGDGDMDLLVSCPDKPFNGLYFFENTTGDDFPDFAPPVRLSDAISQIQVSHVAEGMSVNIPGAELVDFTDELGAVRKELFDADELTKEFEKKPRFNQWKMVDYDGDGDLDVVVGIDDWTDYGWDNAFDEHGTWVNGPLHGYVYLLENNDGEYVNRGKIKAGGETLDVYGAPSPNFADFDGDGDLDLICGEFLDRMTYFENIGTREKPIYKKGVFLENERGLIKMDLEMIIPVAVDWDQDGHVDLVVGDEDGRVALVRNTGALKNNVPVFDSPKYFRQQADNLKFGALVTPVSVDWDQDGDEDIIAGNSAGHIALIENLDGAATPKWAEPRLLEINGEPIRIQAGDSGSIQGPAEAKWGYTTLTVADWDGDGHLDIVYNSIFGKVEWIRNTGKTLEPAQPVQVAWETEAVPYPAWNWWKPGPTELVSQWRTTPYAIDWNKDGIMDLVMLDHEGYLSFFEGFESKGIRMLYPGRRIFYGENVSVLDSKDNPVVSEPGLLRLNDGAAGRSGRRKFTFVDWDQDGDLDLMVNSLNVSYYENVSESSQKVVLRHHGPLSEQMLAGHTTSPTFVDWDNNGIQDILVGAEDGHFYHFTK